MCGAILTLEYPLGTTASAVRLVSRGVLEGPAFEGSRLEVGETSERSTQRGGGPLAHSRAEVARPRPKVARPRPKVAARWKLGSETEREPIAAEKIRPQRPCRTGPLPGSGPVLFKLTAKVTGSKRNIDNT